jgi:hypothetical protein
MSKDLQRIYQFLILKSELEISYCMWDVQHFQTSINDCTVRGVKTLSPFRSQHHEHAQRHAPYQCKSGIRLTTFPSFRAWTFNFSSTLESVHRSGGVRFPVAQ